MSVAFRIEERVQKVRTKTRLCTVGNFTFTAWLYFVSHYTELMKVLRDYCVTLLLFFTVCDLITHRKKRNEGIFVCSKEKHSSIKSLYLGKRYKWEVLLSENRLPTSFLHQNSCHKKTEVNKLKCLEFTLLFMI